MPPAQARRRRSAPCGDRDGPKPGRAPTATDKPRPGKPDAVFGTLRTLFLFVVLTLLFMLAGWVAAGYGLMGGDIVGAMLLFGVLAAVLNFVTYFWSHKFVLWSYRAKIVTEAEAPRLHAIVRRLAAQTRLPMPQVAVMPLQVPNAFATGRNPKHAVVAATQGILDMLDDDELEGVMAHELGHVRNRDMLVMSVAATVAGAITFAARMLFWNALFGGGDNRNPMTAVVGIVFMILAPVVALLVQLAISRNREFRADAMGAKISGKPWALAAALEKMEHVANAAPLDRARNANPSTSSLFIVNPFRGGGMSALFRTHPSTAERVKRLREMH